MEYKCSCVNVIFGGIDVEFQVNVFVFVGGGCIDDVYIGICNFKVGICFCFGYEYVFNNCQCVIF